MQGHLVITVLILFASFAAQAGMTRRFALRGLGEYTATTAVIFLVSVIVISGLPFAASERVARRLEQHDQVSARAAAATGWFMTLLASSFGAAGMWAAWPIVAEAMHLDDPIARELVAVSIVAAGTLGYVQTVYMARLQFAVVGLVAIMQPLAVVVALGVDTLLPGGRPGAMAAAGFIAAGTTSALVFMASGHRPWPNSAAVRPVLDQALRSLPLVYLGTVQGWVYRLLISVILGPAALGAYQSASTLIEGALRIPASANAFLVSAYARISVADADKVNAVIRSHLTLGAVYVAGFQAGLIAGADGIIVSIFGPGSIGAAEALRIMALSLVPGVTLLALTTALSGAGRGQVALMVARVAIPIQIVMLLVATPIFGVAGAASAYVAATLVGAVMFWTWANRHALLPKESVLVRALLLGMAAAFVGALVAVAPIVWPLRVGLAASTVAIVGFALVVGPTERALLRALIQRRSGG